MHIKQLSENKTANELAMLVTTDMNSAQLVTNESQHEYYRCNLIPHVKISTHWKLTWWLFYYGDAHFYESMEYVQTLRGFSKNVNTMQVDLWNQTWKRFSATTLLTMYLFNDHAVSRPELAVSIQWTGSKHAVSWQWAGSEQAVIIQWGSSQWRQEKETPSTVVSVSNI